MISVIYVTVCSLMMGMMVSYRGENLDFAGFSPVTFCVAFILVGIVVYFGRRIRRIRVADLIYLTAVSIIVIVFYCKIGCGIPAFIPMMIFIGIYEPMRKWINKISGR